MTDPIKRAYRCSSKSYFYTQFYHIFIAGICTELLLAPDDLKKLLEFEEKCVAGYFRDKKESQQGSQINQIRSAADK